MSVQLPKIRNNFQSARFDPIYFDSRKLRTRCGNRQRSRDRVARSCFSNDHGWSARSRMENGQISFVFYRRPAPLFFGASRAFSASAFRIVSRPFRLYSLDCFAPLSLLLVEVSRTFSAFALRIVLARLSLSSASRIVSRVFPPQFLRLSLLTFESSLAPCSSVLRIVSRPLRLYSLDCLARLSLLLVEVSRGFSALLLGLSSRVSSLCFSDCLVCPSLLLFGSSLAPLS